ncbi:hypothetical protein [Flavobacterium sp. RSSB_23]|uniref:hypothetical protein n=1 Tax=Flavobacterium sp. RSSB_23 TaxID=3447668 RepID=UPI003F375500
MQLKNKLVWAVEEIKDLIEKTLYNEEYSDVIHSFIYFRLTPKLQKEHVAGLNDAATMLTVHKKKLNI